MACRRERRLSMGVLSLHNECPPTGMNGDTASICSGLVIGEEATSALLRSVADCITALGAMDDTVGSIVAAWGSAANGKIGASVGESADDGRKSYARCFAALSGTINQIDSAVGKYFELKDFADSARAAGRGLKFQAALAETANTSFEMLVESRIELLRKVKVRVKVLQQLEDYGAQALAANDFPEFFLVFMQPLRDLAITVKDLYSEVVRGALASHAALFRACSLLGEGIVPSEVEAAMRNPAHATS